MTDRTEAAAHSAPSGRRIASNVAWTLSARGFAIVAAVVTIPMRVNMMGVDRYAVMGLVWAVLGYLALFDFGMERAVNQAIASRAHEGDANRDEISRIFWTAIAVLAAVGTVGAIMVVIASSWLAHSVFNIPNWLTGQTTHVLWLLALILPLQTVASALYGALESKHRFDLLSIASIVRSIILYVSPLAVLLFTKNLVAVASTALLGQLVLTTSVAVLVAREFPPSRTFVKPSRDVLRSLLRTGLWMNVLGLLGPLMNSIDRILIGALVSTSAVAYYSIAYDSVTRLWVVPVTMAGVLFPVFAELFARGETRVSHLAQQGTRFTTLLVLPITLTASFLAWDVLALWIGQDMANGAARVFQVLALATFLGSIAYVPFALLQTAGRPDIIAKVQLVELPIYIAAVVIVADRWGILGVAAALSIRLAVDSFIMYGLAEKTIAVSQPTLPHMFIALAIAAFGLSFATFDSPLVLRLMLAAAVSGGTSVYGWLRVLGEGDREAVSVMAARLARRVPHLSKFNVRPNS